jgi:putative oxidoreductase
MWTASMKGKNMAYVISAPFIAAPSPRAQRAASIAATVARVLLGLLFLVAGLSGFVFFHNPPPAPPGLAGAFQDVFFRSGWVLFVDGMEVIAGALLLTNRFVPLALVILAGLLYNIYAFHITMAPAGLPAPIIATALWLLVAWPLRSYFAPLFAARTTHSR